MEGCVQIAGADLRFLETYKLQEIDDVAGWGRVDGPEAATRRGCGFDIFARPNSLFTLI